MLTYSDLCNDMNDNEWLDFVKQAFPDMDFSLTKLIFSADESARWRGHSLEWEIFNDHNAIGTCHCCGAWVQCLTKPAPNQIDIGGPAVGVNCGDKVS